MAIRAVSQMQTHMKIELLHYRNSHWKIRNNRLVNKIVWLPKITKLVQKITHICQRQGREACDGPSGYQWRTRFLGSRASDGNSIWRNMTREVKGGCGKCMCYIYIYCNARYIEIDMWLYMACTHGSQTKAGICVQKLGFTHTNMRCNNLST